MELTLIRHGLTISNEQDRMQGGGNNSELSPKGITQAKEAAKAFHNEDYDRFISSPLKRAIQTSEILTKHQIKFSTDERVKEISYGDWENQPLQIIKQQNPQFFDDSGKLLPLHGQSAPNGETYEEIAKRSINFIQDCLEHWPNERVCVICHGGIIRVIATELLQLDSITQIDQLPHLGVAKFKLYADNSQKPKLEIYGPAFH